ncbi:MAG TPA: SpoIID/LytB domain-containing protein [Drouetiella sp.]|jgi:stage II sporulation protein D
MQIRVGLTTNDLTKLVQKSVTVSGADGIACSIDSAEASRAKAAPGSTVTISCKANVLHVSGISLPPLKSGQTISLHSLGSAQLAVDSLKRAHGTGGTAPHYVGTLEIRPANDSVRIILITDLENYVKGVLQSEIPASYHIEAIKAQAVAARTYALKPRIDHTADFSNVCDSFLCCQYFAGVQTISARHQEAISSTANEIITYEGKPILALFSSNAGGCTEDYQSCFSDPKTGEFPPPALPYLQSESEKEFVDNKQTLTESDLRTIYFNPDFVSADSWSPHFRWHVVMPASALEAHMHHEIDEMRKDTATAPFIVPPASKEFGHIKSFKVTKRGKSGSAIELEIDTSTGVWTLKKELVIRSAFKNNDLKLARLKSAKLFFDFKHDNIGLLSQVTVYGLGWGHGVGMQQTGAQGWAKQGKSYKQILSHYFRNSEVSKT